MNSFELLNQVAEKLDSLTQKSMFRLFPQTLSATAPRVEIAGFSLPKVGYHTVSESAALSDFIRDYVTNGETGTAVWDSVFHTITVTILIKSRVRVSWSVWDSSDLPTPILKELHDFFMAENPDLATPPEPSDEPEGKEQEVQAPAKKDPQLTTGTPYFGGSTSTSPATPDSLGNATGTVTPPSYLAPAIG